MIPGSGRSLGGGHGNPLLYSYLENSMDRGLVGYSPRGCKESDTTERLTHTHTHPHTHTHTQPVVCSTGQSHGARPIAQGCQFIAQTPKLSHDQICEVVCPQTLCSFWGCFSQSIELLWLTVTHKSSKPCSLPTGENKMPPEHLGLSTPPLMAPNSGPDLGKDVKIPVCREVTILDETVLVHQE